LQTNKAGKLNFPSIENFADLDGISRTAKQVLSAVQTTIAAHGATRVTTVGHSLGAFIFELIFFSERILLLIDLFGLIGAAISLLDAVYLSLHIPNVTVEMIGYGMPRVCAIFLFLIHSILAYIPFLSRLGIKSSQIMLTPISMSHTSITSQH
jgi:hypothetical protein